MKLFKAIAVSAFFAALFGALVSHMSLAHADASSSATSTSVAAVSQPSDCSVSPADLAKIKAIQNDPTLSYSDELKAELALRKQLLSATIVCAQNESQALQASLSGLQVIGDTASLQSQLSSKLDDANNFYTIELTKLAGVGISGSQAIARETLAYRAGSYDPLAGEVNNFILWSQNQALFATAETRLGQTSRAVAFLENATPSGDLQNALNAAQASFADAQAKNDGAKTALMQFMPPAQSLTLIQQSLSSLSDTYQNFFNVSTIIKTMLPQ